MADVLIDLIQVLKSKEGQERITRQEADFFNCCKSQAIKGFAVGGSIATGLVWVASRKLNTFLRFNLAGGAGFITGMWRSRESIDSCVDRILAMDGSRMQHELRKIVLEKYGDNPQRMQAFARHFYSEEVLSDSTLGHPKSVYRQRNSYRNDERIANSNNYGVPDANKDAVYRHQRNEDSRSLKLERSAVGIMQARINPGVDMAGYGDPLEVLLGYSPANEESHQPDDSTISDVQSRSQRRAHRRHKMRHCHRDS